VISLGCSHSADPNGNTGSTPKRTSQNSGQNSGKIDKTWHCVVTYSFTFTSAFMQ